MVRTIANWVYRLFEPLGRWWRQRRRRRVFAGVACLDSSVDPASELAAGKLVLVGPTAKPKWLRMACPCGCGEIIALNLMTSHYPRWSAQIHEDGTLTAAPSVDSEKCGSHFWIRHNNIQWV
jgi:Family of unknown function (DUF6527)